MSNNEIVCDGDTCTIRPMQRHLNSKKYTSTKLIKYGAVFALTLGLLVYKFLNSGQKLSWLVPYALLFTPFRHLTLLAWDLFGTVDVNVIHKPQPTAELSASEYSYDKLMNLSDNFRVPVVIRGLFLNTTGVEKWAQYDYLPAKLGDFIIPIVRNAIIGTLQDDRALVSFRESFQEMYNSSYSRQYLFFPVKSRYTFNGSEAGAAKDLESAVNKICVDDLDLNRIWRGFGSSNHTTFVGAQFVVGKSSPTFTQQSTGSDWHCAIGNNWFIQVSGRKYWEFVEPKYSAYMAPLKGGIFNMWTGRNISQTQRHVPTLYTTLEEGDLLYNPDWMWHKVTNYGGLSIGIPIRERNMTLSFQNNPYFSSIVFANKIMQMLGLSMGGFPPPSKGTEQDN